MGLNPINCLGVGGFLSVFFLLVWIGHWCLLLLFSILWNYYNPILLWNFSSFSECIDISRIPVFVSDGPFPI